MTRLVEFFRKKINFWGTTAYLLLFVGSVNSIFYPSVAFTHVTSPFFTFLWSAFFVIASGLCLIAVTTNRWQLEFVSLRLLSAILVIYAVVILIYAGLVSLAYLSPSLYIVAFACIFLYRYDVLKALQNQTRMSDTNEQLQGKKRFPNL